MFHIFHREEQNIKTQQKIMIAINTIIENGYGEVIVTVKDGKIRCLKKETEIFEEDIE